MAAEHQPALGTQHTVAAGTNIASPGQPGRKGKTERQSPEGYVRYTGPSQSAHKEERKGAATAQQIIVGFGDTTIRKKAALPRNNRRIEKAARNTDTTKEREADKGRIPTTIDKRQFHYGGIPTSCSGTSSSNRSIPLEDFILVLLCHGGTTSRYVRRLDATADMPLDSDVFRVPPGCNAPQQVRIPFL
ncbi:hypothetical protein DY000_02005341 [Brassica cretica]|uniref:Uncharacterized protein n=1 Tax=Brassica cretica TaxID=69181 RepID=A0ABQ7C0Y0_BRACR|nr:hypothetical protein DY000_02005341 [Brassica cretica]